MYAGFDLPLKPKNIGRYFILHFSPSFHLPIAKFKKKHPVSGEPVGQSR